jgi:CBS-domain-containing membrane protein
MLVRNIMSRDVVTCRREDNLSVAARLMWDRDCGFIPVVDERSRVVGVITDRDICMAAHFQSRTPGEISVEAPMAKWVVTCGTHDSIEAAAELMRFHRVRRLPVLDSHGVLVGVLSLADLARHAVSSDQLSATLGAICRGNVEAAASPARASRRAAPDPTSSPGPSPIQATGRLLAIAPTTKKVRSRRRVNGTPVAG